jgi:hypothetical protein
VTFDNEDIERFMRCPILCLRNPDGTPRHPNAQGEPGFPETLAKYAMPAILKQTTIRQIVDKWNAEWTSSTEFQNLPEEARQQKSAEGVRSLLQISKDGELLMRHYGEPEATNIELKVVAGPDLTLLGKADVVTSRRFNLCVLLGRSLTPHNAPIWSRAKWTAIMGLRPTVEIRINVGGIRPRILRRKIEVNAKDGKDLLRIARGAMHVLKGDAITGRYGKECGSCQGCEGRYAIWTKSALKEKASSF